MHKFNSSDECFHSKQLSFENFKLQNNLLSKHVEDCFSCQLEVVNISKDKKLLRDYFQSFKATTDIKAQIENDLNETLNYFMKDTLEQKQKLSALRSLFLKLKSLFVV